MTAQESFPVAWGAQPPGQAGKCLKKILDKAIKNRKRSKSIVSKSGSLLGTKCHLVTQWPLILGVSGAKLSRLEQVTDEIISFSAPGPGNQPEDGEYMASQVASRIIL